MIKTTTRVLIGTALMLVLSATWTHANLLVNAGFEDSIPFFGWTRFTQGAAPEISQDGAREQENCVKVFQEFSGKDNWCGLYQDVPVKANTRYRLSLYVRNGNSEGLDQLLDGNAAMAKVEWFNEGGEQVGVEELASGQNGLTVASPAGQWMLNETVMTAPGNAVIGRVVLLHVYKGDQFEGGSSWFDDVIFEQAL